ncbi:MAG: TRL-like family protein [Bdellovibrionales bacterium]|nr:TRL-like family protein [Bdellovibrionales bacterium]
MATRQRRFERSKKGMWKGIASTLLIALFSTGLSGCLYTDIKTPLDTDVAETTLGTKVGRASARSYLFLFATGDASVEAAARDGFITTIRHLDAQQKVVLFGLYTETTTIAYGD